MKSLPTKKQLKLLQDSIVDGLPFCSGVLPVALNDLAIYYGKDDNARYLNLYHPSASSLERLASSCKPASFDTGKESAYDESYHKAGKLGSDAFKPVLDINTIGLLNLIRERFFGGSWEQKRIRAELYSMNIYGEGSFFKPHIDASHREDMCGSLILFYPTAHVGGTFLMRKNGKEWRFDSSKVLAGHEEPHLGYVALYSDVEHEVLPIVSGHHINITYNLYFDHMPSPLPLPMSSISTENSFKSTLVTLLGDPDFLPGGGFLGFGLEYAYPLHTSAGSDLHELENNLKGVDADIMKVLRELSLEPSLWAIIKDGDDMVACEGATPDYDGETFGDFGPSFDEWLCEHFHTQTVRSRWGIPDMNITWITPLPEDNWQKQMFIGYGNDYHAEYRYHAVCIIAEVDKPGTRIDGGSTVEVMEEQAE